MRARYPEIAKDIVRRIDAGEFDSGFPCSRFFALDYKASNRTIAKVWDKLKADGIIETKPGVGTYLKGRS